MVLEGAPVADRPLEDAGFAVAVVTRDRLTSARIAAALKGGGIAPVTVSGTADELVSDRGAAPDVVVLEAGRMTSADVLSIRKLTSRVAPVQVVAVVDADSGGHRQALNAGAAGLVYASQLEATLVPTIRAVGVGHMSLPRKLRRCAAPPAFSHREKQVLAGVVRGLANQEIADALYLAESTIKSHLASAFRKLGVSSRKEAAALLTDPREGLGRIVFGSDAPDRKAS